MKTLTKTFAVGLVAMIGAFVAAPASQAETGTAPAGYTRVSVVFSYNPSAPAEKIYGDLQRKARYACKHKGVRPLALHRVSEECIATMVESGVAQFGRADIAELHKGKMMLASR